MREIKFRAWNLETLTMLDWAHIQGWDSLTFKEDWCKFMQYTGLKDKNGKEIYEGDFLEDSLYVAWCDKQGGFQAFLPDDYCMACNGDMHWYEVVEDSNKYEVIGNIYENKELRSK